MQKKLRELLDRSYSPYSKYSVSALLIMNDNKIIAGVNVENASFPAGICAERNAIHSAITCGYKKNDFKELHIMSKEETNIITPCFLCRQTMIEFFDENLQVFLYNYDGDVKIYTVKELCPLPFISENLGN